MFNVIQYCDLAMLHFSYIILNKLTVKVTFNIGDKVGQSAKNAPASVFALQKERAGVSQSFDFCLPAAQ